MNKNKQVEIDVKAVKDLQGKKEKAVKQGKIVKK